jgi:glutamyl-tRNA synthetase
VPLIHGPDGAKLSKRHGAMGVDAYRDELGLLSEAVNNYLLRLGWGHGDDEIISTEQAIEWFDLSGVGRAPSRFDFAKLDNLNGHYLRQADDARLTALVAERLGAELGPIDAEGRHRLHEGMAGLKSRAKTVAELAASARFYVRARPLPFDEAAQKLLSREGRAALAALLPRLAETEWSAAALEAEVRAAADARGAKLGAFAQPLRAALSGSNVSPPIFEVMAILGREETLGRIEDALAATS